MGVRILHAGDIHLGATLSYLDRAAATRRQDLMDTFKRICDSAIRQKVDALLIAGDLFDSYNPPSSLIHAVEMQVNRVVNVGIRVFVVPGAQDGIWHERSLWRKGALGTAHVFFEPTFAHPVTFQVRGETVTIHGVAYSESVCPNPLSTLKREGEGTHIVLMHATVDPSPRLPPEQRHFPIGREDLSFLDVDYVALGHSHRRQTFEFAGRTLACYPGSPEGLDQSETGPRFVALVELGGSPARVDFLRVNHREIRRVKMDVSDCETEDVVDALRQSADDNLLLTTRLVGSPRQLLDGRRIFAEVRPHFFWIEVQDETSMSGSEAARRLAAAPTAVGAFVRDFQTRIKETDEAQCEELEAGLRVGLAAIDRAPNGDAREALADLQRELDTLRRAPGRQTPRAVEQKGLELLELEDQYREARLRQHTIAGLQESQRTMEADIESRLRRLKEAKTQFHRVQQLVDREQELLRLREDYAEAQERMEQFVKAHQQVELARNERAEFAAVETTDLVTLLTLEHGVRDAQQQLLLARQQAKKPVDHLSKYSGIAAGAVIGSYAAYLAYQKWHGAAIFVWLGILLVLSAGVVVAWRVGWLQGDPDLGIPTVQQAMQQLEEAKRKRAVVFEAIGVTTVEETVTLRKTYEFKDRNMEKALAALQALGDEGEAEQRARELKLRVNQEQSIVEEMLETDVTLRMMGSPQKRAEQAAQLQAEVEKIETELEDRRRQQSAIERQLFFEGAEEKDVPALVQRITTVRQELVRLRRRVAALESAHETMARILGQDEGELDSLVGNA